MDPNKITTLVIDSNHMPCGFITARAAFARISNGNCVAIDKNGNIFDFRSWLENAEYHEDQPYLRSKDKVWFIPTVIVAKNHCKGKIKQQRRISFRKLCSLLDYTCQICYEKFPYSELSREHVLPRSKHGPNSLDNITVTCKPCNRNKASIYPFYTSKGTVLKPVLFPIPVMPKNDIPMREEWQTYFIYKKL